MTLPMASANGNPMPCEACGIPHAKCKAHKRNGKPCGQPRMDGQLVCKMHGGKAPQALAKAEARIEEAKVKALIEQYGDFTEQPHPMEVLLHKVWLAHYMERYFASLVQKLSDEGAMIDYGYGKPAATQPHVFVQLHGEWADRAAKYSKDALSAGIDERQIRIAERESIWFADSIKNGVRKLGLSDAEQQRIIEAIVSEMQLNPLDAVRRLAA